jgi:CubicO group peptidase (beta-lactamase class C family)
MKQATARLLLGTLVLMCVGIGIAPPALSAVGEPVQTAPAAWYWYVDQTPAQVTALIAKDQRLVSLRVESISPLLFDVATVNNTGTYAKTWWWWYGQTAEEVAQRATALNARIVTLEPYVVGGTTYFAAIMLHNVGADYSGWWWYYGLTPAEITSYLKANDARLIDLRHYTDGGATRYGVVMVPNTGAEHSGWWWYYGVTPAQIAEYSKTNNAYLTSIDPADAAGTTFNVIMYSHSPGFSWWWYYGESTTAAENLAVKNGARIYDAKVYFVNGQREVAVLMLGNTWNPTQSSEGSCDAALMSAWHADPPVVGLGSTASTTEYDKIIKGLMQKYGVPGGAVTVMDHGKLVLARGYGWSDSGNNLIAHPDSRFRIASLSKQITSAAILTLVEEGKLSLKANPFTILGFTPDPNAPRTAALSKVTIDNLLHHTGGWSRETGCTGCGTEGDPMFESESIAAAQGIPSPPNCDEIIRDMLSRPLKWTPGEVYDYSNFGYCVLGAVIEKVTGMSYASYAAKSVLTPSGATEIVQGQTIWAADREVVYYDNPGPGGQDVFVPSLNAFTNPYGNFYIEAMAAHGAWVASPIDLLRVQGAIDGRTGVTPLLDSAMRADMTANPKVLWSEVTPGNVLTTYTPSGTWYGMGWLVNSSGNWWHTGALAGTATEQVHAANGFGWAAFFNNWPVNQQFYSDLDSDLWTAFNATKSFLGVNLFDQYGPYTGWMDAVAFQSTFNAEKAAGKYPSRLEGYSMTGTPLYRGVFAPFHGSAFETKSSQTCQEYKSTEASLTSEGYQNTSLQSYVSNDGTRRYQSSWIKW